MDIHVRRMANISDMNVQATGIAAVDRATAWVYANSDVGSIPMSTGKRRLLPDLAIVAAV